MFNASDYLPALQQLEDFFAPDTITPVLPAADFAAQLDLELPAEGRSWAAVQADVATYLRYAVNTADPTYLNQLWGGFEPAGWLGDWLTSATNTAMYTYEVAPIATLIEQTMIAKLCSLVGFPEGEGQFTTGGSNGNLMAMAIARHRAVPQLNQAGMSSTVPLVAFVSADAHYSWSKAAALLGIGVNQLWQVPVDAQGQMQVTALGAQIQMAIATGYQPFMVVATAGTTVRGAFDPIPAIAAMAQHYHLWLHVDGAWGASVLLSESHRSLAAGIELADSVVWDAHKMMGLTLMCSVLLVRQRGTMFQTFATADADYLFHETSPGSVDLGVSSMHCGRRVDAVKLWLTWRHLGDRGWADRIQHFFTLAATAEAWIQAHPQLELITPRQSLNLCFQYVPNQPDCDRNALVPLIRQTLIQRGLGMVNYAHIGPHTVFRLVICNNQTQVADLERFLANLVAIGEELTGIPQS